MIASMTFDLLLLLLYSSTFQFNTKSNLNRSEEDKDPALIITYYYYNVTII